MLRERIRACGVVGLGGASFPTSVKVNPSKDQPIHTRIVHVAEREPYITCDDLLMRDRSGDILQGIRTLLHLLGAKQCLVGIEDNKPEAIEAMRLARAESDIKDRCEVVVIPTLYPSGGESNSSVCSPDARSRATASRPRSAWSARTSAPPRPSPMPSCGAYP